MRRRELLKITTGTVLQTGLWCSAFGQQNTAAPFVEDQSGDPDLPLQRLSINLHAIDLLNDPGKSIGLKKDAQQLALRALQIAINDSQSTPHPNDNVVEEYLRLFGIQRKSPGDALQPFCAAGLSHAFCRAYCELTPEPLEYPMTKERENTRLRILRNVLSDINRFYFLPHCATQQMVASAKKIDGKWIPRDVSASTTKPGWLIFYNWPDKQGHRSGLSNHVGIVEEPRAERIKTVEYNTAVTLTGNQREGGHIARKTRDMDNNILGYIRTH